MEILMNRRHDPGMSPDLNGLIDGIEAALP
jgi:hypothetical protein